MHLRRGVAEALELDLAHLTVDGVPVKVHVAGHIVINPRRVSENTVCISDKDKLTLFGQFILGSRQFLLQPQLLQKNLLHLKKGQK